MTPAQHSALLAVTTATLTTVLLKHGIRFAHIAGSRPLAPDTPRIAGPAFTLRFTPTREDLASPASWASPTSTRAAIEAMPAGAIAVADARGTTTAGIFGDILCARMTVRGVAGLVTDGMVRDGAGIRTTGLPVFAQGTVAPASVAALHFVGWNEAIGCGGATILPGDIIVADGDGAVVIPAGMLDTVLPDAVEQERLEAWIMREVEKGVPLPGLYPANAETRRRYEEERGE